VDIPAVNGV